MRLSPALLVMVLVLISGCDSSRNVFWGTEIERARVASASTSAAETTTPSRVVRVYFDRDGDLYPGHVVHAPLPNAVFGTTHTTLRETFEGTDPTASAAWQAVVRELGHISDAPPTWEWVQDEIRRRSAEAMRAAVGTNRGALIVLVHGFNVNEVDSLYAVLRASMEAAVPEAREAAYLHVAWDGLKASPPFGIWPNAQFNFPLVGLGMRQLMVEPAFPRDVAARFLSHSSGAPVVAHALWDAQAAEQHDEDERDHPVYARLIMQREAGLLPAPPVFRDTRVGMIVPAGPATLFDRYANPSTWEQSGVGQPQIARVVLGLNAHDYAVRKGGRIGPLRLRFCGQMGNSCLPVIPWYACSVRDTVRSVSSTEIYGFDFRGYRGDGWGGRARQFWLEEHAWEVYARRPDFQPFVRALLTDGPVEDEFDPYCEGVR